MEEVKVDVELYGNVEIRVGTVVDVEIHPNADSMYVERIDLGETNEDGEGQTRTIVSGLRDHISLEDFKGKQVVIVCNLQQLLQHLQTLAVVAGCGRGRFHCRSDKTCVGCRSCRACVGRNICSSDGSSRGQSRSCSSAQHTTAASSSHQ